MPLNQLFAVVRSHLRRVVWMRGLSRLVVVALLSVVAVALLDWWRPLPDAVRWLLFLGLLSTMWTVAQRRLLRPLSHASWGDLAIARLIERRLAHLDGRLLNLWELQRQGDGGLALPQIQQQVLRPGGLYRPSWWTPLGAAVLLASLVLALAAPNWTLTALQRIVTPWQAVTWPDRVGYDLAIEQGGLVVGDQPLWLRIERTFGDDQPPVIAWAQATEDASAERPPAANDPTWQTRSLPANSTGSWRQRLPLTPGRWWLQARSPLGASTLAQVTVIAAPQWAAPQLTITPPAYTGLPAQAASLAGDVELWPGSDIDLVLAVELPVLREPWQIVAADVVVSGSGSGQEVDRVVADTTSQRLILQPVERAERGSETGGQIWHSEAWQRTLLSAGAWQAELHLELVHTADVDAARTIQASEDLTWRLGLKTDHPPVVRLDGVAQREAVTVQAELPLSLVAQDDLALADLALLAMTTTSSQAAAQAEALTALDPAPPTTPGAAEHPAVQARWPVDGLPQTTQRWLLRVADLATAGDMVLLQAVARDGNDVSGPGLGRSDLVMLEVIAAEELRRRLERTLGEVRDRVVQARDALAQQGTASARTARAQTGRAHEQLSRLVERWSANQLDPDAAAALAATENQLGNRALAAVADVAAMASPSADDLARSDAELAEVERMLSDMLDQNDLGRTLARLIERQQQLNQATTSLIAEVLRAQPGDQTDQRRQGLLAQQQEDLVVAVDQWLATLLRGTASELRPAQELASQRTPTAHLRQAQAALSGEQALTGAASAQRRAIADLQDLLQALRGVEDRQAIIDALAELGARQRAIQEGARDGEALRPLAAEQQGVQRDTSRLQREMAAEADAAADDNSTEGDLAEALADAEQAQADAAAAAAQGNRQRAAAAAAAAAAALAEAERRARQGDDPPPEDQPSEPQPEDVLALLRQLAGDQEQVTLKARRLHHEQRQVQGLSRNADPAPGLWLRRDLPPISDAQQEIALRVEQEVMPLIQELPIALHAVGRVARATDDASQHLMTPALGRRGVQYCDRALLELQRLLAIVDESTQSPSDNEQEQNQQQGEPNSDGQPPRFPGTAQIALLIAEQQAIAQATTLRLPGDWTARQETVTDLTRMVIPMLRPGTPPAVWAQRAERAMASATELSAQRAAHNQAVVPRWESDRAVPLRAEQDLAVFALQELLKAGRQQQQQSSSSSSSGNSGQQQQADQSSGDNQNRQADRGQPGQPESDGENPESGDQAEQAAEGQDPSADRQAVAAAAAEAEGSDPQDLALSTTLMQLPPRMRERLREFDQDDLPAEARPLYQHYLELLEHSE